MVIHSHMHNHMGKRLKEMTCTNSNSLLQAVVGLMLPTVTTTAF